MRRQDQGPLPGPDGDAESVPGLGPYLLICAGAAAWIDLGSLHRLHHSDSMIPVLVSLQAWTPFYWGQDRLGMLVPLLVWPVRSPFGNLLAQGFVNVFCVLAAFVLLARYVRRDASYPVLGAVGAAAFLVLAPPFYRFDLMMNHNFGIWLALGLAGLIAAESRAGRVTGPRLLLALVLILLAHWVYLAAGYYLVVLVGFRALGVLAAPGAIGRTDAPGRSGPARTLPQAPAIAVVGVETVCAWGLLGLGLWFGRQLSTLYPIQLTTFDGLPWSSWPESWRMLALTTWKYLAPQAWPGFLIAAAVAGLAAQAIPAVRRRSAPVLRDAAVLGATALATGLLVGTRRWVQSYDYLPRYLMGSVFFLQAAMLIPLLGALTAVRPGWFGGRRRVWAVAGLLLAASTVSYGLPSPRGVRRDLDRAWAA